MLRVLILSTLFPDAARPNFGIFVERQTRALAARDGVEVRVVAPRGLPPFPLDRHPRYAALADQPAREDWNGLAVHRPRFLNLPGTGGRFHAAMLARALRPALTDLRRAFRFDVINGEFFFPDGPAAIALGKAFGVPVSIKARGSDIHQWTRRPAIARQIVRAGQAADGLLSVSLALRDEMLALGMPAERTDCIVTGVDLARFAPRDRAAAKRALGIAGPLVASVGALIPLKGHDLLIDAVAGLPGVHLAIAGQGPEADRLAARIAALGCGERIRLCGPLPPDSIADLLAAADVMALASASEGLANAWLEALASGTPIVIPDVGGARQVVTSPSAGRIVARTPAALAAGIAQLLAAPPAPEDVRRIAAPFTWEANSERLHRHLERLVARRRGT
ncbi:glycosyltransferase family 4 protein [Sphingomonas sp. ABOLD]|uniref:Glycosyltransferase involved in cell wall biosynthesis n=1 Tax=Sphingomonas trueperi TaxID=53317 RepID=A0A7X5XW63_9SPHN|nr:MULTISPECIES: glycosyltransferase [Sphingomonas]NJB96487.1 glycosyltransferase involved in cell wall biosynthesis [Sphingomonas trueperi]RSV50188.1 glycosyltransferase family 4 protein [Sphingomonas sp. ABOLD]